MGAVDPDVHSVIEEDIQLQVLGDQLMVSGERKWEEESREKDFHQVESQYGSFSRAIALPVGLRMDSIEAVYKKGVLKIAVKKVEPTPSRRVQIQST